jgi:hypothetical protein
MAQNAPVSMKITPGSVKVCIYVGGYIGGGRSLVDFCVEHGALNRRRRRGNRVFQRFANKRTDGHSRTARGTGNAGFEGIGKDNGHASHAAPTSHWILPYIGGKIPHQNASKSISSNLNGHLQPLSRSRWRLELCSRGGIWEINRLDPNEPAHNNGGGGLVDERFQGGKIFVRADRPDDKQAAAVTGPRSHPYVIETSVGRKQRLDFANVFLGVSHMGPLGEGAEQCECYAQEDGSNHSNDCCSREYRFEEHFTDT